MKTPEELIAGCKALILDFDGPVTDLMPAPKNAEAAQRARDVLMGVALPDDIRASTDHLAILRWTLANYPSLLLEVEAACTRAEIECAEGSLPSVEYPWLVAMAAKYDLPIGIATNNSEMAVAAFAERIKWSPVVIAGRTPGGVRLMKPNPAYVIGCAEVLGVAAQAAVFVGDSVSDVQAGRAAGAPVLGLGKSPEKAEALRDAGVDALLQRS